MTKFIYCVYSDNDHNFVNFETEIEAMEFAREQANKFADTRVEKVEVDDSEGLPIELNSEVIWETTNVEPVENDENLVKDNPFDTDFPKSDIEDINNVDDEEFEKMYKDYLDAQENAGDVPAD